MSDKTVKLNPEHLVMLDKPGEKLKTYPRLTKLIVESNYNTSPGAMKSFTQILARPAMREQIKEVIGFVYHNRHALKTVSMGELLKMDPMSAFGIAAVSGIKSRQPDGQYRNPLDKEFIWRGSNKPEGKVTVHIPKERPQGRGDNHFTYNPKFGILDKE